MEWLNGIALALSLLASWAGALHALLSKRDPRSAAAWVTLCVLFPLAGVIAYAALGNNRIETRARRLQTPAPAPAPVDTRAAEPEQAARGIEAPYRNLERLGRAVSGNELLAHNRVVVLADGERAFRRMLDAIESARHSVYLTTYIFESHGIGARFIDALVAARQRGVEVCVLVDGVGRLYSWPTASFRLRRAGVPVAKFLEPRLVPPNFSINLRNHRKLLLVDGCHGFTGGMNIRNKMLPAAQGQEADTLDLHFELRGPVVAQLRRVFETDWRFARGRPLDKAHHDGAEEPRPGAGARCRVITDGPSEDLDKLIWVLVGAMAAAQRSIKIVTPYFLPSRVLTVALQTAALRGVEVDVVLPRRNNLRFMTWAAWHVIRPLVRTPVRVHFFDGPFLHSKLFLIDDYYLQISSANLDPRSLRLNFEVAVEVYEHALGQRMAREFGALLARSRQVSEDDLRRRHPLRRVRDALVWLFAPYL